MSVPSTTTDDEQGGVLRAVRRHPGVLALLVVLATGAGVAVGALLPDEYTAETRLAVGADDVRALGVPGYALGAEQVAASTARYLGDAQALGELDGVLGADAARVVSAGASPIPDSSIVRVEVVAEAEDVALRAAAAVRDELVARSAEVNTAADPEVALEALADVSRRLSTAQQQRDVAAVAQAQAAGTAGLAEAQGRLVEVQAEVDVLTAERSAAGRRYEDALVDRDESFRLVPVAEPGVVRSSAAGDIQRYAFLGLVLGGLVGVVVVVALDRRSGRRAHDVPVG